MKKKNFLKFSEEVLQSIKRCLESGLESKDIAPEIKGSRSSYAVEATQIIEAISNAIFTLSTVEGQFQLDVFTKVSTSTSPGRTKGIVVGGDEVE